MATYTVKPGDTLSAIGKQYGVDYNKITGYKSGNPNLIRPGEVLTIPDAGNAIAPPAQFSDKGQVQSYTNAAQNTFVQGYQPTDIPKVSSASDIAKEVRGLLPTSPAPTAPNLTEMYAKYRQDNNLDSLEAEIRDLTAEEDSIIAARRQRTSMERDKPVATNVMAGRVGEVERQENERLDAVSRFKARKVEELTSRQQTVQIMMNLTQQDYQNAKADYDTKFTQAMNVIELVRGIRKDQLDEQQKATDNARANLTVYANALKDGSVDLNSMSSDQRAQLNKLEMQSGFPIGFLSSIKKDPKADIISTTSNNGQIQVLLRNPDGSMSVKSYGTPSSGTGNSIIPTDKKASSSGWKIDTGTSTQSKTGSTGSTTTQKPAAPKPTPAPAPSNKKQPISSLW